jgi:hypothetical protein
MSNKILLLLLNEILRNLKLNNTNIKDIEMDIIAIRMCSYF